MTQSLIYWGYNWRKGGGSTRMIEISKRENFYQQEYCGCVYSLRDTNPHRVATGRERIKLGEVYYGQASSAEQGMTTPASPDVDTASSS
jgi:predicted adenine nucleotide alpha hydrolase (AANH) superfamily ATPase